jgi:hypothetical protein
MPSPRPVHLPAKAKVTLELPSGDRYHLHPRPADLEGYLAPERVPHLTVGISPVKVQVEHGAATYLVSLAPDELEVLLRRARLETKALAERPPRPTPSPNPPRGRGRRDPRARRLGPNADHSPDPEHRGPERRKP